MLEGLDVVLGGQNAAHLDQLVRLQDPIIKVRALSLLTTLASATPEAAELIRSRGKQGLSYIKTDGNMAVVKKT